MKYIETYNKLLEGKNEKSLEDIFAFLEKNKIYHHREDYELFLSHSYVGQGGFFNGKVNVDYGMGFKFIAYMNGKNTKVILIGEGEHDSYTKLLSFITGKKLDLFSKKVVEGTYNTHGGHLEIRGVIPNDVLDIIVGKYEGVIPGFVKDLIISIGSSWRAFDTVMEIPYKEYTFINTDISLSLLWKIIGMYKPDDDGDEDENNRLKKLLQNFDIVSAVNPLPNNIQSKIIDKFNRMFKKSPNMKIKILPKGMSQAEYNHKKTRYKFTESKDNEL